VILRSNPKPRFLFECRVFGGKADPSAQARRLRFVAGVGRLCDLVALRAGIADIAE
jgi:hypothetical protein